MAGLDSLELLYMGWALLFQVVLIVHFAMRKWFLAAYLMKYGWIVFALALPAVVVSVILWLGGESWWLWLGGVIFLAWAVLGYTVDYAKRMEWRAPVRWSVFGPYVLLYLATAMFYWWPVGLLSRPLWYVIAILFVVGTVLDVSSHTPAKDRSRAEVR